LTIEKDNGYVMSHYPKALKQFWPCNHTSSTGFCYGYATEQFGPRKIKVNSHSLAALPWFTAARNSFISPDL
jgi:nitrate/nitrite transporter NarK